MNPSRQQFLKSLNRTTFDLRLSMVQLLINNHRREPSWTSYKRYKYKNQSGDVMSTILSRYCKFELIRYIKSSIDRHSILKKFL